MAASSKIDSVTDMTHTDESKFVVPGFTIKQLLGAIPAECFERSALHSSLYIVQDVTLIGLAVYLTSYISGVVDAAGLSYYGSKALSFALWSTYWFWTGLFATGIWIIAHECGHQAFSESKTINNAVGWVLHSACGVPYHSWRISHGRHHAATGHIDRDEVFVPRTRDQLGYPKFDESKEDAEGFNVTAERQHELAEAIGDAPLFVLANLIAQQLVGWQMYLTRNASGQKHYPPHTNHFSPTSVIFDKRHYRQILASDLGIVLLLGVLGTWGYFRGFAEVATYYLVPYLWMNHWLVSITFLQHTDPMLPHYSNEVWRFSIGCLATADRNILGPVGPYLLHGICETHVSHHVSSKIPHYNAWKATDALKEFLGPHYQYRQGSFLVDLYKNYRDCAFVDHDGKRDVIFYKSRSGTAKMTGEIEKAGDVSDSGVDVTSGTLVAEKTK